MEQLTCFDLMDYPDTSPKLVELPRSRPQNYKKGKRQTVYPIKRMDDIISVANWLSENKSEMYVLAFTLGINMGLRASELLSIRYEDVYWSDGTVRYIEDIEDTSDMICVWQSKTSKYRCVFLNQACRDALESVSLLGGRHSSTDDYLFPSREGGHIEVDTFRKVLKEAASACGIKQNVGTHTCRKTWGWWQYKTNCVDNGIDITMLQRAFGHSSSEITLRYLGITDEEDKALYHGMNLHVVSDSRFCNCR